MSGSTTTTPVIAGLACGIALIVLFSFLFNADATHSSGMANNSAKTREIATDNACLPKTLSSIIVNFLVKQPAPASMPAGFNLEGVDSAGGALIMYYADHSLCPFTESFDGQIDKGAIVITVSKIDGGVINDSTAFQNEEIAYYANHTETIAKVQPITINGNKGVGWNRLQELTPLRQMAKLSTKNRQRCRDGSDFLTTRMARFILSAPTNHCKNWSRLQQACTWLIR